ncbi:MAG TPA: pyrroline-5-carboxylate reductase [Pirellulales bacterium]|nr:pyrroline-5-carboxylate reductase [Pirellulales bacterium]
MGKKIGFVGAGQMARALAGGFVSAGLVAPQDILAADPDPAALDGFGQTVAGFARCGSNAEVAKGADLLVLAVKPQQVGVALAEVASAVNGRHLVVSIAAGIRLATLAAGLPAGVRLVRVMPNTPALVGESASGYALGTAATPADAQEVQRLLESVGQAFRVEEKLLDAVTGLAGSGPAFVYVMIEALSDGGVRMGLQREVALALAAQTVKGAAEMVLISGEHPAVLKDKVTSPGGTTIAGLAALEQGGLRSSLIAAVEAASRRSIELGNV